MVRSDPLGTEFIELGRTFREVTGEASGDDADVRRLLGGRTTGWADLLSEHRVVILSEAGSGKTEEIRQAAKRLRSEGKPAFFLRLEHVVADFEEAFEEGTLAEFQAWQSGDASGWLLLDSVDEVRLRDPRDFEAAIRRVGLRLASAAQRAHVILTGRTAAWRPRTDPLLFDRHLPYSTPAAASAPTVGADPEAAVAVQQVRDGGNPTTLKVFALDDLSPSQVEAYARAKGMADPQPFLDAIERADAWTFAARPLDLQETLEFWFDRGRIGSRLELMGNSIGRRLLEPDQNRAEIRPLSAERARIGARLLAAATTLAREPTLRVPDGAAGGKGLPVGDLLLEWDDVERGIMLDRPVFDEAIYGTVRFHHRSVREFLAAEWAAEHLKQGAPRQRIEELFFREQYGLPVVVPTTRPLLPWLALLDARVLRRVEKAAPEVLFEGGDPSRLPAPTRRRVLRQACEQLAAGELGRTMVDYAAVQRFAGKDLTDDVRVLLDRHADNDDVLWFLLRVAWHGQMTGVLPEAKRFALSPETGRGARAAAFRVVDELGSPADGAELRDSFLHEAEVLDRDGLAELLQRLRPAEDAVNWLFRCLPKVADCNPNTVDRLEREVTSFVERSDLGPLQPLIERANLLLGTEPVVERRHCEVSKRFGWLLEPAGLATQRLIEARDPAALHPAVLVVLHRLTAWRAWGNRGSIGDKLALGSLVPGWPELNLALFWHLVGEERRWLDRKERERLTEWWQALRYGSHVAFKPADFDHVLAEIARRTLLDDRLVALSLAFKLYGDGGRQKTQRRRLTEAAAAHPELGSRLDLLLNPPPPSAEHRKHKRQEADWKRRGEARAAEGRQPRAIQTVHHRARRGGAKSRLS